ncbi:MAG TPA: type II toxin-antitoxin system RelE/ParE family toxin [Verrucomicrobiae bacterium]|nr:type II toxin-antitoxin system RelE/ParE family toxin [Verrucomicrobiae bacterium]
MGFKIIFSPQAIADLKEVVRHIARDDPATAVRVGYELIDRVEILENFPLLGAPYAKRPGVRKLVSRHSSFSTVRGWRKILWTSCVTGTARAPGRS